MDVRFSCHNCGQHIAASEDISGQRVNCPGCQQQLTVPNRSSILTESKPAKIVMNCKWCHKDIRVDESSRTLDPLSIM